MNITAKDMRVLTTQVYGRLRNHATGEPVTGARVVLGLRLGQAGELILSETRTDAEGLYCLIRYPGFRPGQHQMGIAATGYRLAAPGSAWSWLQTMALGLGHLHRSVTLLPGARLGGRVVRKDGTVAAGGAVKLNLFGHTSSLVPGLTADQNGRFMVTDATGDPFRFGAYPVGAPPVSRLQIRAATPGVTPVRWGPTAQIQIRPGESLGITIQLS
ncbi:MAG: hypothetical protein JWN15_1303 [Firmicutes bacterium]|nr:hypothetical protein [Bacillota bacterium]